MERRRHAAKTAPHTALFGRRRVRCGVGEMGTANVCTDVSVSEFAKTSSDGTFCDAAGNGDKTGGEKLATVFFAHVVRWITERLFSHSFDDQTTTFIDSTRLGEIVR